MRAQTHQKAASLGDRKSSSTLELQVKTLTEEDSLCSNAGRFQSIKNDRFKTLNLTMTYRFTKLRHGPDSGDTALQSTVNPFSGSTSRDRLLPGYFGILAVAAGAQFDNENLSTANDSSWSPSHLLHVRVAYRRTSKSASMPYRAS